MIDETTAYPILLGGWMALAAVVFVSLMFVNAPYGRHRRDGWGPTIDASRAWFLMELPAVVLMPVFFLTGRHRGAVVTVFLVLWLLHYVHRTFVFPFRLRGRGRRAPIAIVAMAFAFNIGNAYFNGRWLFELAPRYDAGWLLGAPFLVGVTLFLAGWTANLHADRVLLRLRRPGESGYKIPRGGLYRWVSCPNYLGEVVEWIGWAIATWSLGGASFALWTAANLIPRALAHHRWYRRQFPDYPPERRALVPFVL